MHFCCASPNVADMAEAVEFGKKEDGSVVMKYTMQNGSLKVADVCKDGSRLGLLKRRRRLKPPQKKHNRAAMFFSCSYLFTVLYIFHFILKTPGSNITTEAPSPTCLTTAKAILFSS